MPNEPQNLANFLGYFEPRPRVRPNTKFRTRLGADAGSDLSANPDLANLIERAKLANMPKDRIQKAIDRGTGTAGGETGLYEGTGPGGVGFLIQYQTDNKFAETLHTIDTA
mmetsp:Transcript_6234/g.13654  ORF Transcript_6234/g.13654 Transcript_6234/m.13654 type:complete len:111 (+) Transcript_6234:65-397(+)